MKPFIVLLVTYLLALLITRIITGDYNYLFSGNIAMSIMLVFTSIGHFIYTKGMMLMMPDFIPYKKELVYFTGVVEIAAAIGLLIPSLRHVTAILLIIFFILVLSANINAAIRKVDYEKATYDGPGIRYLWFRLPLQIFLIAWVVYFGL
jgi:uncharacterized membrane protein